MVLTGLLQLPVLIAAHRASELVVTPEEFGAIGDGKANDWLPINQALAACSAAVYHTRGAPQACRIRFTKSYLSGPLIINSSYTTLDVVAGAKLGMLQRPAYEAACPQKACDFISTAPGKEGCRTVFPNPLAPANGYKVCLSEVTVTGGGIIDGMSSYDPTSWWLCARLSLKNCWRPNLAYFSAVAGFTINGTLTLKNAPNHFVRLDSNVLSRVSGLTIDGKHHQISHIPPMSFPYCSCTCMPCSAF